MAYQIGAFVWSKVPWKELINLTSTIIRQVKKQESKSGASAQIAPIRPLDDSKQQLKAVISRLEALEASDVDQITLIKEVTEQLQSASRGLAILTKRTTLALVLAVVSVAISVGCIAALFLRHAT